MGSGNGVYNGRRLFRTDDHHAGLVPLCGLMKAEDFNATNGTTTSSGSSSAADDRKGRGSEAVRRAQAKQHQRAQTPHAYSDVNGGYEEPPFSPPGMIENDRVRLLPQNGMAAPAKIVSPAGAPGQSWEENGVHSESKKGE